MTAFQSRWLDWQPENSTDGREDDDNGTVHGTAPASPETPSQQTDRTDKSPSVSFVSASPKRFQPEIGGEAVASAVHDYAQEQPQPGDGISPSGWGDATEAVAWFLSSDPPGGPFVLWPGDPPHRAFVTVLHPALYWRALRADVVAGPGVGRDYWHAVRRDVTRLYTLFGNPCATAPTTRPRDNMA